MHCSAFRIEYMDSLSFSSISSPDDILVSGHKQFISLY